MTSEQRAVEALFHDIRNRRLLKWFFSEQPHQVCSHFSSIDPDVQGEIREAWEKVIAEALRSARLAGWREGMTSATTLLALNQELGAIAATEIHEKIKAALSGSSSERWRAEQRVIEAAEAFVKAGIEKCADPLRELIDAVDALAALTPSPEETKT